MESENICIRARAIRSVREVTFRLTSGAGWCMSEEKQALSAWRASADRASVTLSRRWKAAPPISSNSSGISKLHRRISRRIFDFIKRSTLYVLDDFLQWSESAEHFKRRQRDSHLRFVVAVRVIDRIRRMQFLRLQLILRKTS